MSGSIERRKTDTETLCLRAIAEPKQALQNEAPRLCRRLQMLRKWSHRKEEQFCPGGLGTGDSVGHGTHSLPQVAVGDHLLDGREDRVLGGSTEAKHELFESVEVF